MKPLTPIEIVLNRLVKYGAERAGMLAVQTTSPAAYISFDATGKNFVIKSKSKTYEKRDLQGVFVCLKMLKIWNEKKPVKQSNAKLMETLLEIEPFKPVFIPKTTNVRKDPEKIKDGAIKVHESFDLRAKDLANLAKAKRIESKLELEFIYDKDLRATISVRKGKNLNKIHQLIQQRNE
jgi:hypothetical protein